MRKNIPDLSDRNDIPTGSRGKIEDCLAGRRDRDVPAGMSSNVSGLRSAERSRDNPSDIERFQKSTSKLTDGIEPLQAEFLLVCCDLKDAVRRRVTDRFPGSNMLVAQPRDDLRSGGMAISKYARKCRPLAQAPYKFLRKTRNGPRKTSPFEWNGHAGKLPVP